MPRVTAILMILVMALLFAFGVLGLVLCAE